MAIRFVTEKEQRALVQGGTAPRIAIGPAASKPPDADRPTGPKVPISIRLDADVVAALKAQGPGWQPRANALLRSALGLA